VEGLCVEAHCVNCDGVMVLFVFICVICVICGFSDAMAQQ
jgi:hypothetical protein